MKIGQFRQAVDALSWNRLMQGLVHARSAIESARATVVRWEGYRAEAAMTAKPVEG